MKKVIGYTKLMESQGVQELLAVDHPQLRSLLSSAKTSKTNSADDVSVYF